MATKRKGAAGVKPAAAIIAVAPAAAPSIAQASQVAAQTASDAAKTAPGEVIFAQQPGQIASVLAAPVLDTGMAEGDVITQATPFAPTETEPSFIQGAILVRAVTTAGRWRIGRHFTQAPTQLDPAKLSEDELARLLADPQLIVSLDD